MDKYTGYYVSEAYMGQFASIIAGIKADKEGEVLSNIVIEDSLNHWLWDEHKLDLYIAHVPGSTGQKQLPVEPGFVFIANDHSCQTRFFETNKEPEVMESDKVKEVKTWVEQTVEGTELEKEKLQWVAFVDHWWIGKNGLVPKEPIPIVRGAPISTEKALEIISRYAPHYRALRQAADQSALDRAKELAEKSSTEAELKEA